MTNLEISGFYNSSDDFIFYEGIKSHYFITEGRHVPYNLRVETMLDFDTCEISEKAYSFRRLSEAIAKIEELETRAAEEVDSCAGCKYRGTACENQCDGIF